MSSSQYWKGVEKKWKGSIKHFKKKEKTIKQLKKEKQQLLHKEEVWNTKQQKKRHKAQLKKEIRSLKIAREKKTVLGKLYHSEYHVKPLTKTQKKRMIKTGTKILKGLDKLAFG